MFSANDKANLINDAFILPHGGDIVTYDQTISLVRRIFNPVVNYIPWTVFIWHWNYLMGVEEHSRYFDNFKVEKQTCSTSLITFLSPEICHSARHSTVQFSDRQPSDSCNRSSRKVKFRGRVSGAPDCVFSRLIRSMIFELLCRVQNTDALNKATEFFRQIPPSYFSLSTSNAKYDLCSSLLVDVRSAS